MAFSLFNEVSARGHEQVVMFNYPEVGLRALVGIHSTTLGPGLGGCRIRRYADEAAAIEDVLRLSEGMTYKSSLAGMPLGGGKACILYDDRMEDPSFRRALFVQFGKCVDALGGRYVTAEDMGTSVQDIEWIKEATRFATGTSREQGGAGDPSPFTALGVFRAILAASEKTFGSQNLSGKKVAVQGAGHVGLYLIELLVKAGASVIASDVNSQTIRQATSKFALDVVGPEAIYDANCDIYAPCAIGQTVNANTIPRLKCKMIAGAANNQLQDPSVYQLLEEKGILYLPDFAINSGGVISVGAELNQGGWNESWVTDKVMKIFDTTMRIIEESDRRKLFTEVVAIELAKERIAAQKG